MTNRDTRVSDRDGIRVVSVSQSQIMDSADLVYLNPDDPADARSIAEIDRRLEAIEEAAARGMGA